MRSFCFLRRQACSRFLVAWQTKFWTNSGYFLNSELLMKTWWLFFRAPRHLTTYGLTFWTYGIRNTATTLSWAHVLDTHSDSIIWTLEHYCNIHLFVTVIVPSFDVRTEMSHFCQVYCLVTWFGILDRFRHAALEHEKSAFLVNRLKRQVKHHKTFRLHTSVALATSSRSLEHSVRCCMTI